MPRASRFSQQASALAPGFRPARGFISSGRIISFRELPEGFAEKCFEFMCDVFSYEYVWGRLSIYTALSEAEIEHVFCRNFGDFGDMDRNFDYIPSQELVIDDEYVTTYSRPNQDTLLSIVRQLDRPTRHAIRSILESIREVSRALQAGIVPVWLASMERYGDGMDWESVSCAHPFCDRLFSLINAEE